MTTTFTLRIPDALNDKLTTQAQANNRSRNQEIVDVLSRPDFDLQIGKLEIEDGDVLVVKMPQGMPLDAIEQNEMRLRQRMPGVEVLFLENVIELAIIRNKLS